jgi:amino acid adenylation domain-containing protein
MITNQSIKLSKSLQNDCLDYCKSLGVTIPNLLLGTLQILLHRYSDQKVIFIGSLNNQISSNNISQSVDSIQWIKGDSFSPASFENSIQRNPLNILNSKIELSDPLETLLESLQPKTDTSGSAYYKVFFNFSENKKIEKQPMSSPNLTSSLESISNSYLIFDFFETNGIIEGLGKCNVDLWDPDAFERMTLHFVELLKAGIRAPQKAISQLPILTLREFDQLTNFWNQTQYEYSENLCAHQIFESIVEKKPEAIAAIWENKELTYKSLNIQANQLACYLKEKGIKPNKLVGICVEKSFDMVVGILAILKAGGAFVPLDPSYPSDRLEYIFKETNSPILLTQRNLLEKLPFQAETTICLDEPNNNLSQYPNTNPDTSGVAQNLAYVIFTSGSTGKPKGILLRHNGLCNLIHSSNGLFKVHPESRILQFSSFGFDVAVWEIFTALLSGGALVFSGKKSLFSILELPKIINEKKITLAMLPPSLLSILPNPGFPSLETIVAVGERCTNENVDRWSKGQKFFNGYGPAEGHITVTACLTNESKFFRPLGPTIGRPLYNVRVFILDKELLPVPIGVPGEMHLGGICIANGYLNRPELTQEKFIANPFSDDSTAQLYKTGDLARYLPNGEIEFLGRADNQIKIRGFRVELGEIESTMNTLPTIARAVAILRNDSKQNKILTAYFIPTPNETHLSEEQLRQALEKKLPEFMIPQTFVKLDDFPLSPNGKIDRDSLPEPTKIQPSKNIEKRDPTWLKDFLNR